MRKSNFEPLALPRIPECKYVYHVVKTHSKSGKTRWIIRKALYSSYVLRLRYWGDDELWFASEIVASDTVTVKMKYQMDVEPHAPKGA